MSNASHGSSKKTLGTFQQFFDAYERLPAIVRRELRNCAFPWAPTTVAQICEINGAMMTVLIIQENERREIENFAKYNWPAKFGLYPHVAAQATIMRGRDEVIV